MLKSKSVRSVLEGCITNRLASGDFTTAPMEGDPLKGKQSLQKTVKTYLESKNYNVVKILKY